jgi:hypothetical protein
MGHMTMSVLEPAIVTLPASIQRISILPVPGKPRPSGVFDSLKYIRLKPDTDVKNIKMGYLHGFYEVVKASPRFQKVVLSDTSFLRLNPGGRISWDIAGQICQHDTTDVLLVLSKAVVYDVVEALSLFDLEKLGIEYLQYPYSGDDQDYQPSYSSEINVYYKLINHTKWTFYSPSEQTKMAEFTYVDSLYGNMVLDPKVLENMLYQNCYLSGSALGIRICPTWKEGVERIFFTGPGRDMRIAARYANKNQWTDAATLWNKLSDDEKKGRASRAAYNMAIVWERDDDLDQAVAWITYADSLQSSIQIVTYKSILENRLKSRTLLDEQMKGN